MVSKNSFYLILHTGIWPETKRKKKNTEMGIRTIGCASSSAHKKNKCMGFAKPPDVSGPPFPQLENENSGLITKTPVITKMLWLYKRNKTSQVLKRMRVEARQNFTSWIK